MNARILGVWMTIGLPALAGSVRSSAAETLAERLLAENERIQTVRCEIRRETDMSGRITTMLSRVWYRRPDRMRVVTETPAPRRILVDGAVIYKWIEGQPEGVRLPLADASAAELVQVRRVPGTAEEYLLRLRGLPETELPPTAEFPVRRGYEPPEPHPYTVLSADDLGRLARVEFFDPANRTNRLLRADFSGWKEVQPGCWIAVTHKTSVRGRDGTVAEETLRVSGLAINEPLDDTQFDVARWAAGITFLSPDEMSARLRERE